MTCLSEKTWNNKKRSELPPLSSVTDLIREVCYCWNHWGKPGDSNEGNSAFGLDLSWKGLKSQWFLPSPMERGREGRRKRSQETNAEKKPFLWKGLASDFNYFWVVNIFRDKEFLCIHILLFAKTRASPVEFCFCLNRVILLIWEILFNTLVLMTARN